MADTDVQTSINETGDKGARAARAAAETATQAARKGADTVSEGARAGLEAEQRSFAAAGDASRQSAQAIGRAAQSSLKAGQEMARHSQDIARRASDQAADFWRASLTPMTQLQNEFGRWFDQMWRRTAPAGLQGGLPLAMLSPFTGQPLADLKETSEGFELSVELPGLTAKDVDLSVRGDTLVLSGEKSDQSEGERGAYRFSERRFGRFERAFALPPGADPSKIDASFKDGLLRVSIPASPEGEPSKAIPVKG